MSQDNWLGYMQYDSRSRQGLWQGKPLELKNSTAGQEMSAPHRRACRGKCSGSRLEGTRDRGDSDYSSQLEIIRSGFQRP
jgi:hypothetical protein